MVELVPALVAALALALYARGLGRARGHGSAPAGAPLAFAAALAVLAVALAPPLDALAHESVAAHMGQHLLLVLVAAPLLARAAPLPAMLLALPPGARRRANAIRRAGARALAGAERATLGLGVAAVHALSMWAWHAPPVYAAAEASAALHVASHATLLAAALAFWWPIARPGRPPPPATVLGVLLAAGAGAALGALMALSSAPWYATSLADQQLAGALMWGAGGPAYALAAAVVLVRHLRAGERRDALGVRGR